MSLSERLRDAALARGGIAIASLAVFYAWMAPTYIVDADNAEFATIAGIGGVPHPSGYPAYALWLRAWSWLPTSPAHAAALATAALAVVQIGVLHAACRAWGARPAAATLAVLIVGASPLVLRFHTEAEVFALNGLVIAAILWLAARGGPLRGTARVVGLALVAGIGLSDHLTCVLVAPVGILGIVRGLRESPQRLFAVACGTGALAIGLLPYLYLVEAPETAVSWTRIDSMPALIRHVARTDYGVGALSGRTTQTFASENLFELARSVGRAYLWGPALLGLGWFGVVLRRGDRTESRAAWATLLASVLVAGPVLIARFNIDPGGVGLYIVQRFHLLPIALLAVPVAVALDRGYERLGGTIRPSVAASAIGVVFIATIAMSLAEVQRGHSRAVEAALTNTLRSLPDRAIVLDSTDDFHFGTIYLQAARGIRPDVTTITTPHVGVPFYRERIRAATGFSIENASEGEKLSVRIAEKALATGRPVFIDPYQANVAATFPTYPYGILFRVLPPGSALPPIGDVFATNKQLFAAFDFDYPRPYEGDQLAAQYHRHYTRTWTILAKALARVGAGADTEYAAEMAEALSPQ